MLLPAILEDAVLGQIDLLGETLQPIAFLDPRAVADEPRPKSGAEDGGVLTQEFARILRARRNAPGQLVEVAGRNQAFVVHAVIAGDVNGFTAVVVDEALHF